MESPKLANDRAALFRSGRPGIAVSYSAVPMVPVNSGGPHNDSSPDDTALAPCSRFHWRWKSRRRGGRPRIEMELRALIRLMSTENQLWGAPRIHGELLKLGLASLNQPSPGTWSSLECLDHIIVLGEVHLRQILQSYALLQRHQNASIIGSGCAGLSPNSANRKHQITRHPWRTSPPLRPSLSVRYTLPRKAGTLRRRATP